MIGTLNDLVDRIETALSAAPADQDVDLAAFAREHGTTEYHLRRMFASLAGMPVSEYVRRRRMTRAGADLVSGTAQLLDVAVRHGYGSVEAFSRAFRSVHDTTPAQVRREGGPLRTQPTLRFELRVAGRSPMDVTIIDRPAFTLVGHAAEVPLIHTGVNPHIQAHIAAIHPGEHVRLKELGDTEPAGILAVTDELEPDAAEGSPLTYLHGVAVSEGAAIPEGLDVLPQPAGAWAVFHSSGPFPEALQTMWAATATEWFPSQPWRLRPGPSILRYLTLTDTHATCELWLPVERDGDPVTRVG